MRVAKPLPRLFATRGLAAATFAVLLAACTSLGGPALEDSVLQFELQARMAMRYRGEGGSARLVWRHAADGDDMQVNNPLGQGIARIVRESGEVRLITPDGQERRAVDAESLTESALGWALPLQGLPDWVRGRPEPGKVFTAQRDEAGVLRRLEQDGWAIEYLDWENALPVRLTLSRGSAGGGENAVEVRLVVDRWTLPNQPAPRPQ